MVNGDIYKQIEEHIRGRKFDQSNAIKIQEVKAQVYSLINGNRTQLKNVYGLGCFITDSTMMSDSELLLAILKNCDEEVLLGLEIEFGKKSKISEIIREKILNISAPKNENTEETITTLESMLKESEKVNNKLYSLVCKYMDERGFQSDAEFYNSIFMSRQNFARIRNKAANIGKETVLWIICGLGLNYIQAYQVLSAAGYMFKPNDKRDVIISYITKNIEGYDLDLVNEVLYHFGLRTFFDN
ncbi:hypothetical protein [Butyricicoccus pullicaecorum]|uniref:Uncharacterized protein n=1 Tax=Butyricicoccus pullicaecorum 1.2 TaxID=1203606 RepID=R8W1S3_9FIRM|nr:hypothetical protein [Butyricicoccus pullicaecorum]EOQ38669.1 hypothetical protein HMPREF1526_01710 [Butyricicoccus pullicaecorum 1.2]SKA52838.1 hypothetical protein SAMN02745978_00140 [Butyricicoccus pullicaecorum DSM 23266]